MPNRSNRRSEMGQTALKGRVFDKNPTKKGNIKGMFDTLEPDEIYDLNLLHQMRRASSRS